ncbi:hypothetical protein GCM10010978_23720 [Compostibacillus humi]|uniref:Uncharacterized protein n=1 Tax=Compostibacillus humi TaxID=1245525 RepID=A0A8J2TQC5_9BACI|nr:hypothetical protein GCM10010978_23720 [Compostibacillus humi]
MPSIKILNEGSLICLIFCNCIKSPEDSFTPIIPSTSDRRLINCGDIVNPDLIGVLK